MNSMEIVKRYNGGDVWHSKKDSVIYVEKEEDVDKLFDLLLDQDEYWARHKDVIKVWEPPKSFSDVLSDMVYCGKTDIYCVDSIRKIIPFIFFQAEDGEIIQTRH